MTLHRYILAFAAVLSWHGAQAQTVRIIPLDLSMVVTGGVAVTALNANHAVGGGFLVTANTAGICVDQQTIAGTVTGTPASTICAVQNQQINLVPSSHAVSVNSSGSSVTFAGEGLN